MPRPKSTIPAYRLHKGTGQAVAYIDRREHYLGVHGSTESRQKYAELVSQVTAGDIPKPAKASRQRSGTVTRSVAALCLRFMAEKLPQYAEAEQHCVRGAIKILAALFGETPSSDFGPLRLRAVRNAMVAGDRDAVDSEGQPKPRKPWSRDFVNKQVKRIKHLFRWGVSWELVPSSIADALTTVESLKIGETDAPEGRPRRSVPDCDLQAVRSVLTTLQRDIFDLLLLTGARPGEIIGLTTEQIDRSGDVWRVDLAKHKTAHKGKERKLFFNHTAQTILLRYLKADPVARLFPIRLDSFGAAVKSSCTKAGVPEFTPHWLRHTVATRLADDVGTEAAQRLLGHAGKAMTEHYSRAAEKDAINAARRLG
jgi:integrase